MKCNKCGYKFNDDVRFCTNCGNKLSKNKKQFNSVAEKIQSLKVILENLENTIFFGKYRFIYVGIIVILIVIFLICLLSTINFTEIFKEITTTKALNCEDETIKDLVISIAKDNDYFYKDISADTISNVYIKYPAVTKYEQDIDRYHCTGQFVVESVYGGFKPTLNEYKNHYYNKFHRFGNTYNEIMITKNTKYVCNVEYTSQVSEGKSLVRSTYCSSGGGWFESGNQGTFSCESSDCEPIIIQKGDSSPVNKTTSNSIDTNNDYSSDNYNSSYSYTNSYTPPTQSQTVQKSQDSFEESENTNNIEQQRQNIIKLLFIMIMVIVL